MSAAWLLLLFAGIAAVGNALFALAQRQSSGTHNTLLFVAASALVACLLCGILGMCLGSLESLAVIRAHWKSLLISGTGLFLTYLGFNLLYTHFGAMPYVVYASMSILTTTIGVGILYLKETVNSYQIAAVLFAIIAVVLFSVGQSRA